MKFLLGILWIFLVVKHLRGQSNISTIFNSILAKFTLILALGIGIIGESIGQCANTITFNSTGNDTWIVPAGVTSITIEAWGGGGGGAGSYDFWIFGSGGPGGGGGGGAYSTRTVGVFAGQVLNISVGSGGAGGNGNSGENGGNSSVIRGGSTLAQANGGQGGNINGNGGARGINSGFGTFTGGTNGGNATSSRGGNGGNGGIGGDGGAGQNNSDGDPGDAIGGGGGGSRTTSRFVTHRGGDGARGEVLITYSVAPPTAGAISGAQSVCQGGDPAIISSTAAGTGSSYRWESAISPFVTWIPIGGATSATYNPPAGLAVTTQYRRVSIATPGCESTTAPIQVTVQSPPNAGSIAGTQAICSGGNPGIISNNVAGSGSSYRWERAVIPFTTWTIIGGATSASYDPPGGLTQTTQYRRVAISSAGCESTTVPVEVTVNQLPTANAGPALTGICQGQTTSSMGGSVGGSVSGGTWSGGSGTWNNPNDPANATYRAGASETGTITLTLTTVGGTCGVATATKTLTITSSPVANAGAALAAICDGETSAPMGGSIGGAAVNGTWTNLNGNGTWTNANNPATATYTAGANDSALGLITLQLTASGGSCSSAVVTKTIRINPGKTVTPVTTETVCFFTGNVNLTHGTTGVTGIGTITNLPAGVTPTFNSTTGDINITGNPTELGTFTYSIELLGTCGVASATGTIIVEDCGCVETLDFATNPSGTWVVPNGVTEVIVEGWGGGGRGGRRTSGSWAAGGGGGGGYSRSIISVNPNDTFVYSVGRGGTTGNINGGNTTFGSGLRANGGSGVGDDFNGGAGATIGTGNDATYRGGNGGGSNNSNSGGGGSSGYANSNGNNGGVLTPGSIPAGSEGGNGGPGINTSNTVGQPGQIPGGGGGGGSPRNGSTYYTGGDGGAGRIKISYSLTAGIVNGPQSICVGGNTTFTSTMSGGVWSSANPAIATVNPSTGVITGISAGAATIRYTITGCSVATSSRTVFVNAPISPGTLSGNQDICIGGGTQLLSTTAFGTWSSANPAIATVSSTGLVTGISAGTVAIFYRLPASGGCPAPETSISINVTAPPDAGTLSGIQEVCEGSTRSFSSTSSGGIWSSGNPSVATVNPSTGIVTGIAPGTAILTYSVAGSGGCPPDSETRSITVTKLANAGTLSGVNELCVGGNNVFTSTTVGGVWSSSNPSVASINSSTGNVIALTSGTTTISYTVAGSGSCANDVATRTLTINPLPTPTFTAQPSGIVCIGEEVTYSTQLGQFNYDWQISGVANIDYSISSGGTSTSNSLTLTWLTQGTKQVFLSYSNSSGCSAATFISSPISVSPLPVPTFNIEPSGDYCLGQVVTYTTQSGRANYDWNITGVQGTDYTITAGGINTNSISLEWLTTGSKTVTVNYENSNGCQGVSPASNTITLNQRPVPTFLTAPTGPVCIGQEYTYTTQSGSGITNYEWLISGNAGTDYNLVSGGTTSDNSISIIWLTNGEKTIVVNYFNSNGCLGVSPAISTLDLNPLPVPTFTIEPSDPVCIGDVVTYTTEVGQSNYAWTVSGTEGTDYNITAGGISSGSNTVSIKWLTNGAKLVTVGYTNSNGCTSASLASNTITLDPLPVPTFTVEPSDPVCIGEEVTYTTESGQSNYVWSISGSAGADYTITGGGINNNSSTVSLLWLTDGIKTVSVNYTDTNGCAGIAPASNSINLTPLPLPTFTSEPTNPVCLNDAVTYTTQNGQSDYVWVIPGTEGVDYTITGGGIGNGSNTISIQWLSSGTKTVTVNYTDAKGCSIPTPASNSIEISTPVSIDPVIDPGQVGDTECFGDGFDPITITATGSGISYQWYRKPDNSPISTDPGTQVSGATSASFTPPSSPEGISYYYVVVSGTCGGPVASDLTGAYIVSPSGTSINIDLNPGAADEVFCFGTGTFTQLEVAATGDGGIAAAYQWYQNTTANNSGGVLLTSENNATFTPPSDASVADGLPRYYYATATSPSCGTVTSSISGAFIVNPLTSIDSEDLSGDIICEGQGPFSPISVTASGTGTLSYQWYSNTTGIINTGADTPVGTSSNTFTPPSNVANGVPVYYYVVVSSSGGCGPDQTSSISGAFVVNELPIPTLTPTPAGEICVGASITYTTETGQSNYVWTIPGTAGTDYTITSGGIGATDNSVTLTWLTAGIKNVSINYNNSNNCTAASATVNSTIVNALPVPTFIAPPPTQVCLGTSVTYSTQSGQSNYIWTIPGVAGTDYNITAGSIGNTSNTVTLTWLTNGAKLVSVNYTNGNNCNAAAATINSTIVNALPTPTFTSPAVSEVCIGAPITYTTQPGQSIYTWTIAGTAGIDYNITAGGIGASSHTVTLRWLTSGTKNVSVNYRNASNCSAASAVINSTTVNALPVPSFTTTPPNEICVGNSVTYSTEPSQSNYVWTLPGTAGTDYNITAGGIGTSSNTVTLTWLTAGTKNVSVNYTNSTNCTAAAAVINSTIVNSLPVPTFSIQPSTDVCVGTTVTYTTQSGQDNYLWTVLGTAGSDYTITAGGIGQFDNSVTLTWLSSGIKNVSVNYSNSNNCTASTAVTNSINVNQLPAPTFTTAPSSDLCIGSPVTYSTQSGQSNYIWTVPGTAGTDYTITGGGIGPTNHTVTLTWLTSGTKNVSVNYSNAGGCTAVSAVTNSTDVNVTPVITDITGTIVCSGSTFTVTPLNGTNGSIPSGTTYTWTVSPNGNVTGESNQTSLQSNISQTLTNTSLVDQTVTYTVTPTTPDGCVGNTFQVNVLVRPRPTVNDPIDQNVGCSGQSTAAVNFTGNAVAGVVYNWTNSHPEIGLAASGTGNIPAFVTQNTSPGPITATITVTPTVNGCPGPSESFTITVDPTPVITLQTDYCAVDGAVLLVANSNVTGTTWAWSTGETTASIVVDIAGSYSVTATSPNGCTSTTSISIAEELIVDGSFTNFDPNNLSFFTEYTQNQAFWDDPFPYSFATPRGLHPDGRYAVNTNANYNNLEGRTNGYHPNFHGRDHTNNATGPRNFLMVNGGKLIGSPLRQPVIWRQEVPVDQFTEYYFSAWAMNLNPGSPARLQFKINGQLVGTVLDLDGAPKPTSDAQVGLDNWREFRSNPSWSSGTATTAIIEIVNLNTDAGGNDFAIDDISFGTLSPFIRLTSDPGTNDSQIVCEDTPIEDIEYAVGGGLAGPLVTGLPVGVTATWNGVNLRISGSPTSPGEYIYEVFTTGSCQQVRVEGLIIVKDVPDVGTIASDQTVCSGVDPAIITGDIYAPQDAGAIISYRWELNTNLGTPNWTDVPGNPWGADYDPPILTQTTQFRRHTISTVNGLSCESPSSNTVTITIQNEPTAGAIAEDQTICEGEDPDEFSSATNGTGDGTISYRWEYTNSSNPGWNTIVGAIAPTYKSTALDETTQFRRITISTLNGAACESVPTTPIVVTVTPVNTVVDVDPDPTLCLNEASPIIITHTTTGVTGIVPPSATVDYNLPNGVTPSWNAGVLTVQGTPTEMGVFNYDIPLSGGCGTVSATGTITVENPTYPFTAINVVNPGTGDTAPFTSEFTVFSNELTLGTYTINYSIEGVNGGPDQTIPVTVSTAGQFTFTSLPYSNEGTTTLKINWIKKDTENCTYYPPNNNTAIYGFGCSSESLQSGGDDAFYVPADVYQVRIEAYGDGSPTESQTIPVIPGGVINIGVVGNVIFATQAPLASATVSDYIVSATGPNGRIVFLYDCNPPVPACPGLAPYEYTDSEGYTIIRFDVGACEWNAPDGLDEFEVLIVGGGGGGGYGSAAGGGGGGGVVYQRYTGITMNGLPGLQGAVFPLSVGANGSGSVAVASKGGNGQASTFSLPSPVFEYSGGNTFSDLNAAGGGGGGSTSSNSAVRLGETGASGGGGAAYGTDESVGGLGIAGNGGGDAIGETSGSGGGGGGGSASAGGDPLYSGTMYGGTGGAGLPYSISGTEIIYGAGGGATSSGAITNQAGNGGSPYGSGYFAGGNGTNNGMGQPSSTYGSGGGAGRDGGGMGFPGVIYIRYPNFRILPVEYGYFHVKYNSTLRSGDLTWATSKEWENERFEIERSVNTTKDWKTIGEVTGAGYSEKEVNYDFSDSQLPVAGGNIFYRLKQFDFDGDFSYSETRSIKVEALSGTTRWKVYPNPTTGNPFNIEILDPSVYQDEPITLRIISATGQFETIQVSEMSQMGAQVSEWFTTKAAGIYTLEISWGTQREYHKVILRR